MRNPPFCPNPRCALHSYEAAQAHPCFWIRRGTYTTKCCGVVQRFVCSVCGYRFSERTVSIDYYTKKSLDYKEIQRALSESESVSAIARELGCSVASAQNRIDRLGRNAIAFHARLIADHKLSEDLCADGFESFDVSQYFPNAINILVGTYSQFLYGFTHATLRRKGRMTVDQKAKREKLEKEFRPKPDALKKSFKELLESIDPLWDRNKRPHLVLRTDQHKVYPVALKEVAPLKTASDNDSFEHRCYSSRIYRDRHNPLFPVNYFDRELRKDISAYHRESVCFCRDVSNGLLRLSAYLVWHNYFKRFRIVNTREKPEIHAVEAGISKESVERELERYFVDRAFLSQQKITPFMRKTWLKLLATPLHKDPDYCQKFAHVGDIQASRK